MINPDNNTADLLKSATASGNDEELHTAINAIADERVKAVLADMNTAEDAPMSALINNPKYNLRHLSAKEIEFYKEVTVSGNTMTDTPLPTTIYERVFEDLKAEHPLLSKIQFVNTAGVTEFVMRDSNVEAAAWGKLCDPIIKQLDMAFVKKTLNNNKLSAFVNLCKSMIALGPVWLDRFVREVLAESIAVGLESAIVAGTGKDQPIGMIKDLGGAVVDGVYPDKTPVALTAELSDEVIFKEIMEPMTKSGTKIVNPADLLFIVNPSDYYLHIAPGFLYRATDGTFIMDKMAVGATVIQSAHVPTGSFVVGKAKDYFMGLAAGENISFSDDYRFLEDDRVYVAKLLAHGEPVNNDAFAVYEYFVPTP